MRNEKVQLSAFLNSKDAKIRHLHKTVLQREQEKQEVLLQIENMKYNIKSHDQMDAQAVKTMKKRIDELELQLEEARSEAQAYFKGAIERNLDSVKLGNKVNVVNVFCIFSIFSPSYYAIRNIFFVFRKNLFRKNNLNIYSLVQSVSY